MTRSASEKPNAGQTKDKPNDLFVATAGGWAQTGIIRPPETPAPK